MPWRDKDKKRKADRERVALRRFEWMKLNGPCKKCGTWDNLELDHVDRKMKVTHRIWSYTEVKRVAELAKCQVLCKDCHLKKSYIEGDQPLPVTHGNKTMYEKKGCRCNLCKAAHTEYQVNWRQNKKLRGVR